MDGIVFAYPMRPEKQATSAKKELRKSFEITEIGNKKCTSSEIRLANQFNYHKKPTTFQEKCHTPRCSKES